MDYTELVKSLRICTSDKRGYGCASECSYGKSHPLNHWCMDYLLTDAADAIERLADENTRLVTTANELSKMYDKLVDEMPDGWIPVTERLPGKRTWVLCWCVSNSQEVLRWENNEWYHDPMHVYFSDFVTHWMPLPEPPKEDEA